MSHIRQTGGNKEFYYTENDSKRIEKADTKYTKEFKATYKNWLKTKPLSHKNDYSVCYTRTRSMPKILILILISILGIIVFKYAKGLDIEFASNLTFDVFKDDRIVIEMQSSCYDARQAHA